MSGVSGNNKDFVVENYTAWWSKYALDIRSYSIWNEKTKQIKMSRKMLLLTWNP